MNIIMFIVGTAIFTIFIICLAWDIGYNKNKTYEDKGYYERHQPEQDEFKS